MKNPSPKMWANAPVFIVAMVALSSHLYAANAPHTPLKANTIHYQHTPLFIHLKPHTERWVSFPGQVQVDARGSGLTHRQLRVINNHGTIYLTAYQAFGKRRLLVHVKPSRTVLMDVQADRQGDAIPVRVVFHRPHRHHLHRPHPPRYQNKRHRTISLVSFMRAGIHAVYQPNVTPRWLKKKTPSVSHASAHAWLKQLAIQSASPLTVTHIQQWETVQHPTVFITAITFKNRGRHVIPLSLNTLTVHAKAASLYPATTLKPKASTTLFLLSQPIG